MRRHPRLLALTAPLLLLTGLGAGTAAAATPVVAPTPTYGNYAAGAGQADGAGEPSIGNDWQHDVTAFQSNLNTYDVHVTGAPSTPGGYGTSTWLDKTNPAQATSLDPILFTDPQTGRTVVSQLLTACSQAFFSDDLSVATPSYTPSQGCGLGTAFDHQTIGGGPYPAGSTFAAVAAAAGYTDKKTGAPHAVYYCAQYSVSANCARSDDGGLTFGNGVPIYNTPLNPGTTGTPACAGLHGHLRVAPDGTVYVPNFDCDGHAAVTVSTDAGQTWTVHEIPGSTTQDESDPSVGIATDGTVYFGWEDGASNATGSTAKIVVSHDRGQTWSAPSDVSAPAGVKNIQFPEVIAGDPDRAAFAFIGSTTGGNDQLGGSGTGIAKSAVFPGVWHMYVATTYNGGASWTTVDATPTTLVQRGCVWLGGGSTSCRNLLDFNDITIDKTGRVLVGWSDGCVGVCEQRDIAPTDAYDSAANAAAYRANHGTITRQETGLTLFSAYDAVNAAGAAPAPVVPEAPVAVLLPLGGLAAVGVALRRRRRA